MRSRTRYLGAVALVASLSLLLVACGGTGGNVAATVGGQPIEREQVNDAVRDAANASGMVEGLDASDRAQVIAPLERQVLALLVQAQLIDDLVEDRGLQVDEAAIDERYEADVTNAGGEEELGQLLAQQQISLSLYRDVLVPTQLRVDAIVDDLAGTIEDEPGREARHILLETEEEAQAVLAELADGADFAELAQARSTDPGSGSQGGDLGLAPVGAYVGPFDEAVWDAEIGDVIGPVESVFGFHIIEVTGEQTITADDLSEQQRAQQTQGMLNQLLEARFTETEIEVDDYFGTWNPMTGEIVPATDQNG